MPKPSSTRPINVQVGELLRSARRKKKITQTALALQLDVSFQQIQKHETGETALTVERLIQVSNFLEIPVTDLLPRAKVSKLASPPLNEMERTMVARFRQLPSGEIRLMMMEMLKLLGAFPAR